MVARFGSRAVCVKTSRCASPQAVSSIRCHGKGEPGQRTFCRQDAGHNSMDICKREIMSPGVPVLNNDEPDEETTPFLPRFLLQEITFAHCLCELYFNQPRPQGNRLCRADWLCPRGIARSCRFEKSPPTQGAASANTPAKESAPRRAGPCRHLN